MMEMVKARKEMLQKQGKKGFTLVELIVVIVILGILAAIAVPALVGYIDKARTDGAITEAATARTSMQVILSDAYGHQGTTAGTYTYTSSNGQKLILTVTGSGSSRPVAVDAASEITFTDEVQRLTSALYTNISSVEIDDNFVLTKFIITVPNAGKVVEFDDGVFTVRPTP